MMKSLCLAVLVMLVGVPQVLAQKQQSDREADEYKGRVKEVATDSVSLRFENNKWVEDSRRHEAVLEYDRAGNRHKQALYDYKGNLSLVRTYRFIDGEKVSIDEDMRHDHIITMGGSLSSKPRDERLTYKYKYKYDSKGRRLEEAWYHNDGSLWLRYVSVYDKAGNEVEWFRYTSTGELNGRRISTYDSNGRVKEESWFGPSGERSEKWSYTYETDSIGNWIKRKDFKWGEVGGKAAFQPYKITYRRITYF